MLMLSSKWASMNSRRFRSARGGKPPRTRMRNCPADGTTTHPSGNPVYWATSVAPHIRYNSDLGAWPSSPSTMKYEHPRLACQTGTESPAAPRKMQQRRSKAELMVMKAGLAGLNATIADHGCLRRKYRSAPVGDRASTTNG